MERRYGIGLFAAAALMLAVLSFAYYREYMYHREMAGVEEQQEERAVSTAGDAKKEDVYYLRERNGYLVVYQNNGTDVFEYTNIRVEELPQELQQEITDGKQIEGRERLYGFLENYSS